MSTIFSSRLIPHVTIQGLNDSWYLNLIATDPDFQRRGIATMLLETVYESVRWVQYYNNLAIDPKLSKVAESNATVALCASNEINVFFKKNLKSKRRADLLCLQAAMYESLGFINRGRIIVTAPAGQFPCICLTRDTVQ